MGVAVLVLLLTFGNGLHKTKAVTAPDIRTCQANQPAILKMEHKDNPKATDIRGVCFVFS